MGQRRKCDSEMTRKNEEEYEQVRSRNSSDTLRSTNIGVRWHNLRECAGVIMGIMKLT